MIYKYRIGMSTTISLPYDSRILTAQRQHDDIHVWVELGTHPKIDYEFYFVGTGWDQDTSNDNYISTVFDEDGYVWHVFYKESNV